MKAKIHALFIILATVLSFSCVQPNNTNDNSTENATTENITPGWYLYTTNADSAYPQKTYLYINTSGAIERAGSTQYEYTGSQLEMIQEQLSYTICRKNADGTVITFVSCESPTWENGNNEHNNISTCPYAEGEYLDVTKHDTFSWPVNKNLPLWSEKENNYYVSCSNGYGYIDSGNVFIAGSYLSAGDTITITMEDTDSNSYFCDVNFTEAGTTPVITLPVGYEWWCFEDAYLNNGYENFYVLYFNGEATRNGIDSYEITEISFLYKEKDSAINNYAGTKYQVTDLTKLPSWCY